MLRNLARFTIVRNTMFKSMSMYPTLDLFQIFHDRGPWVVVRQHPTGPAFNGTMTTRETPTELDASPNPDATCGVNYLFAHQRRQMCYKSGLFSSRSVAPSLPIQSNLLNTCAGHFYYPFLAVYISKTQPISIFIMRFTAIVSAAVFSSAVLGASGSVNLSS